MKVIRIKYAMSFLAMILFFIQFAFAQTGTIKFNEDGSFFV